jgi:biopolymer transport protein TolR
MGGGAAGPGGRRKRLAGRKVVLDQVRNDINVTPLVDVVLVLLIIFMVVTPLMARGKEVPLPQTRNHSQEKDKLQPVVALDPDGNLWFDKEKLGPVTPETLAKMKTLIQRAWDAPKAPEGVGKVYVKASRELPYRVVYPLIIAINDMGVQSIDLATNELKEGK